MGELGVFSEEGHVLVGRTAEELRLDCVVSVGTDAARITDAISPNSFTQRLNFSSAKKRPNGSVAIRRRETSSFSKAPSCPDGASHEPYLSATVNCMHSLIEQFSPSGAFGRTGRESPPGLPGFLCPDDDLRPAGHPGADFPENRPAHQDGGGSAQAGGTPRSQGGNAHHGRRADSWVP